MPLVNAARSALLVVDVQEKLFPHIHDSARVLDRCIWLVRLARRLDVPVLASEQYPEGLGPTVAPLAAEIPGACVRRKVHFSCVADGCFDGLAAWARPQVVVCGTESHVCVLQSAIDLRASGRAVFVVEEAVSSRRPADKTLALERMRAHGIEIVSGEMAGFEWLRHAGDDRFRDVNRAFFRAGTSG
ncbi:MAG: isochorismatase family protein [Betaproteobacteria bacterium]|nr:isochorismatase family protein [Betaproteobacteria bacterium]